MWDERYNSEEYAYGTAPNDFLAQYKDYLPQGKILSIAEGEGRNAIFLAKNGCSVTAVDSSAIGLEKAKKLAKINNVSIDCIIADLMEYEFGENCWDGIISIFCPLQSEQRIKIHRKIEKSLRTGGVFLTESYTPNQIKYNTGGGGCEDTMQSKDTIIREFKEIKFSHLIELEREVIEGVYHTGLASVVQAIGIKN